MNDLPAVALAKIFNFFSVTEKLKMKLICKTWKFVIETYNLPQSLCLYSLDYPSNEHWCSSGQRVAENEMFYLKFDFECSRGFSFKLDFLQNLQSLYLFDVFEKVDQFLEEVNQLTRLKVLMIDKYEIKSKILSSFSLENLYLKCRDFSGIELAAQRFNIQLDDFPKLKIKLDTPNLTTLSLWIDRSGRAANDDEQFEFGFPLKIKHLRCFKFNSNLSQLKNLETLCCQEIILDDFKLQDFKSLVKLEVYPDNEEKLELIKRIKVERDKLNREGLHRPLQLVVSGFNDQLVSCEKKGRYESDPTMLTPAYLEQIEKNRSEFIGPFLLAAAIEIGPLLRYADKIPEFFEHFPKIHSIEEYDYLNPTPVEFEVRDEAFQSRLIDVIKKSNTQGVTIHRMNLAQKFYFQLARIESIKSLSIRNYNIKNFDYNCFLQFKALTILFAGFSTVSIEFLCKMFKQLNFLGCFHFGTSRSEFHIHMEFKLRNLPNPFSLGYSYTKNVIDFSKDFKDLDDLEKAIKKMEENKEISHFLSS